MRSKSYKLLLLAVLLTPLLAGRASAQFTTTPLRVLTVGDSITAANKYQAFLRTKLANEGVTATFVGSQGTSPTQHEGHSGWQIGGINDNVTTYLTNSNANVVLLQIGVNNMNHGLGLRGVNYPPYQANVAAQAAQPGKTLNEIGATWNDPTYGSGYLTKQVGELLDKILNHANAPTLIVAKIPGIGLGNPSYQSENNDCDARIREYNGILEAAVKTRQDSGKKIRIVDNYALGNRAYGTGPTYTWGDSSQQTGDWVHPRPDSAAWEGMATNFFNGMKAAFAPTNLIANPSFDAENYDTKTPTGWNVWEGDASGTSVAPRSSYTEAYGGSNSGSRHGTHYNSAAYQVYTYQTKTGLTNGKYTLRAYARRSGNQTYCYLEVAGCGSAKKTVNIPASSTYQLIEIKDIDVTSGTCTIGFWTVARAGEFSYFDDVSFFKQ